MIDSRVETYKHIQNLQKLMNQVIVDLIKRAEVHDQSKLVPPEKEGYDKCTEKLNKLTYGSAEYKESLEELRVTLDHHYKNNTHHPEYFENGILDMTLMDIMEMLLDWFAATKRHADGNIYQSIEINQSRFHYPNELKQIFINTVKYLEK